MFVFWNNFVWGAVGVVKMYKVANVSFKLQSNQVPRIKYFWVHIPPSGRLTYFFRPQKQSYSHSSHFQGPRNPWRNKFDELLKVFQIHLTFIKNILNFKINRSTFFWTDKKTTPENEILIFLRFCKKSRFGHFDELKLT